MTLATTDPTMCPDCGGIVREMTWAQDAMFFHGGYGGSERSTRRVCECGWAFTTEVATERPPKPERAYDHRVESGSETSGPAVLVQSTDGAYEHTGGARFG